MNCRFAPLDLALPSSRDGILDLFNILSIPSAFSTERVKSVSHSFAAIADADGTSTWFHFLCKNVSISNDPQNFGVTYHAGADVSARRNPTRQAPLPQADYSYIRSGFFMRTTAAGTTLTCFGLHLMFEAFCMDFLAVLLRTMMLSQSRTCYWILYLRGCSTMSTIMFGI